MKSIFTYVTILFTVTILLTGCKKDDPGTGNSNPYFVKFKSNGTQMNYTALLSESASTSIAGGQYIYTMTGFDANSNISFVIYDTAAITTKAYTGYNITMNSKIVGVTMGVKPIGGTGPVFTGNGADDNEVITITEITPTGYKGTLSGTVTKNGQPDIVLTEGTFYVQKYN